MVVRSGKLQRPWPASIICEAPTFRRGRMFAVRPGIQTLVLASFAAAPALAR